MSLESIQIRLAPHAGFCASYRVCHRIFHTSKSINTLAAFQVKHEQVPGVARRICHTINDSTSKLLFKGNSWLAGRDRQLSCSRTPGGFVIEVPQVASFCVSTHQPGISQLDTHDGQPDSATIEDILLGPPLMLTLALNQLFALHASAVVVNNKAVLFVGESGFGKSTLAHWLNDLTPLKRLSDDISVLEYVRNEFKLLPDFPQMKLPDSRQHANAPAVELGAIVLINRWDKTDIELNRLDALNAIQTLVNHSVATQLFDKPLAQQYLSFMSELTQKLPLYSLNYPNGREYTGPIAEILAKQIN